MFPTSTRIAILGAGLAGLSAAYQLKRNGLRPLVLEAEGFAGGVVRTIAKDGFTVDYGPNTMQERHLEVRALISALGLSEEKQFVPSAAGGRRFIVRDGRLAEAPTSAAAFMKTPLLSLRAKVRILGEPFVRRGGDVAETVESFARRRFGSEAASYLFDPFVSGIYAGRAADLAVGAAFPRLAELEQEFGSVILGSIRSRPKDGQKRPDRRSFSFQGGMKRITERLAADCDSLELGTAITAVRQVNTGWQIDWRKGEQSGSLHAEGVISTIPPYSFLKMGAVPAALKALGSRLDYVPVAVLALSLPRSAVAHPLDGFGVLVPSSEPGRVRGALFSSTLFPDRAPQDRALLTVFLGGSRYPEDVEKDSLEMLDMASDYLGGLLGFKEKPTLHGVQRWPMAIPQYNGAYLEAQAIADDLEAASPTLKLAGNYRGGVAAADAMKSGLDAANVLSARLS